MNGSNARTSVQYLWKNQLKGHVRTYIKKQKIATDSTYVKKAITNLFHLGLSNFLTIEDKNLFLDTRFPRMSLYIRETPSFAWASGPASGFPFPEIGILDWILVSTFSEPPLIDCININDIWSPSPKRLSKNAGYLKDSLTSLANTTQGNMYYITRTIHKRYTFHSCSSGDDEPTLNLTPEDLFQVLLDTEHRWLDEQDLDAAQFQQSALLTNLLFYM